MRRIVFALAVGMIAVWFLLAVCSGDNATAGASTTGTSGSSASTTSSTSSSASGMSAGAAAVQAYCDAIAGPFCEAFMACCPDPQYWQWLGGTAEHCKKNLSYGGDICSFRNEGLEASINAGHTAFNQAGLDACVARLQPMSIGGEACVESPHDLFNACTSLAFHGQLAPGEPCAKVGSPAVNTSECKHGHCDMATHTCITMAQLGETCGDADPVGSDPYCDWGQGNWCVHQPYPNGPPICIHQVDIGDPCVQDGECKSLNCDTTVGKCTLPSASWMCW